MRKSAAAPISPMAWMSQILNPSFPSLITEPPVAPLELGKASKSVSWHDIDDKQIEERDLYNELLRRLSVNTSSRDELLFLFLQIFCAENQNFDIKDLAPRVDEAFASWVEENCKTTEPLLLGESCACIRLARLERKLSHVLCILTLMIKATIDPDIESLSQEVIARGFVAGPEDGEPSNAEATSAKVFDNLLQLLLALWSQISAVKLQIATRFSSNKMLPKLNPPNFPEFNLNSAEALRLIVSKLPPT